MPTPEQIASRYAELPVIDEYVILHPRPRSKDEAWEANERGGHFRLFRCRDKYPNGSKEHIILSISGAEVSKERLIADFAGVFGKPIHVTGLEEWRRKVKSPKVYVIWEKSEIATIINLNS